MGLFNHALRGAREEDSSLALPLAQLSAEEINSLSRIPPKEIQLRVRSRIGGEISFSSGSHIPRSSFLSREGPFAVLDGRRREEKPIWALNKYPPAAGTDLNWQILGNKNFLKLNYQRIISLKGDFLV